jgi:hypothetical protein
MYDEHYVPGEWPDISIPGTYRRLVQLARKRLHGSEHHADDVVSRALIKWIGIPADKAGTARIEQVIRSEAYSLLRSESRLHERERRAADDRLPAITDVGDDEDLGLVMLRRAMNGALARHDIQIATDDLAILDLLWAGETVAGVAAQLGLSRYAVRQSRERWRRVVRLADEIRLGWAAD